MKTLKFADNLVPLILSSEKTVTWRLFDDKDLQIGDELEFINKINRKKFAEAKIIALYEKRLADIEEGDYDGHEKYESNDDMIKTLKKFYGEKVDKDSLVKIIKFEIIKIISQIEKISMLMPYKIVDGEIFVYLQKRDENIKGNPGKFGAFGGHMEDGESPEETLEREIEEEMSFIPKGYEFFGEFTCGKKIDYTYILEVDDDFENKIKINEGEYGKFFSEEEVEKETMMSCHRKEVLIFFSKK